MRLLLDTHVFLWLDMDVSKLSASALAACEAADNELYLSLASVWEIQIKHQLGKLALPTPLEALLESHRQRNGLQVLGIELAHVYGLQHLPAHHGDPFDRLLLSQAQVEDLTLVSADGVFRQYGAPLIW